MVFHMAIDLYQVLDPCLAKRWDSEVALLTSHEGDRWPTHC